jgi:hypothetical protein
LSGYTAVLQRAAIGAALIAECGVEQPQLAREELGADEEQLTTADRPATADRPFYCLPLLALTACILFSAQLRSIPLWWRAPGSAALSARA